MLLNNHELKIKNYIDGQFVEPTEARYFSNLNPATGEVIGEIPDSSTKDVECAVDAAKKASPLWRQTPVRERARWLRKLSEAILNSADKLAFAETLDNGKTLSTSQTVDIPRAAYNFEFFADAITQFSTDCFVTDSLATNFTLRQPLGVVGCISPWNLPLYLLTWKIAPALAAGNTVVAKPSEVTPLTAHLLSKLCQEVGLPKGVLNIVYGYGPRVGGPLVEHQHVNAISFTGSTATGRSIALKAAESFKKVSLEMGGKNAFIVFADADLEHAAQTAVRAAFSNQGQICLCGSRFLVEESIYERFKKRFLALTKELVVGDPMLATTHIGALVSQTHLQKVSSYIDIAMSEGGKILCGGERVVPQGQCGNGFFFAPTIIENLDAYAQTNQEEIFGPIVTLAPFSTEDEAIEKANCTKYGLSASVMTESVHRAQRIAFQLEAGIVWLNTWMLRDLRTPFGGVKESGIGREGGIDALRFMTEVKNVCLGQRC